MDSVSVEKTGCESSQTGKSISVESQPKQMPITTIEMIILTDMGKILSSSIGGEMAMKIEKMLTQATTINWLHQPLPQRPDDESLPRVHQLYQG